MPKFPRLLPLLAFALTLIVALATTKSRADEGMWTFDNFPAAAVKQNYGADITPAWLDRVRTSTIRLSNCTASFVSAEGLILTNHHCSAACLAQLSKEGQDLERDGFIAGTRSRRSLPHAVRRRADADGKRHRQGQCGHRRQGPQGGQRRAQKVRTQLETACEKALAPRIRAAASR